MNTKEQEQQQIRREIQKYLAKGGKIKPVDFTANKGWRERHNKTGTYMPLKY